MRMIHDAFEIVHELCSRRGSTGHLLVGLDFDGTLAPIVPRPEDAALPPGTRALLERIAARPDTRIALVSGRGLDDLEERVAIDGLYYAGNHGLEIRGPGVRRVHEAARAAAADLAAVARQLGEQLARVEGAIVEDKGLTLSVHYRLVDDAAAAERVRATTAAACQPRDSLRVTQGKKVLEIRPAVDWHKGRALRFLLDTLAADSSGAPAIFIGDDRTDEDAFRELGDDGWGIVVGDPPADTAARASLPTTDAVVEFLRRLA
jgi:trehalose 6-phosphate phosphatase